NLELTPLESTTRSTSPDLAGPDTWLAGIDEIFATNQAEVNLVTDVETILVPALALESPRTDITTLAFTAAMFAGITLTPAVQHVIGRVARRQPRGFLR